MEATLQTIDRLAATLQELQPIRPEYQQRLDKKIRLEFNYNSNHIEGNTLTYGETELLLIFDKTTGNHELREYEEMKSHDVAFEMIKSWAADKERPLTETAIKNLHELLLVRPFWKEAITPDGQPTRRLIEVGAYKKYPNSVRLQNGEMFHYASPEETPIQMGELVEWFKAEEEKQELHPVALAALLHYKFVRIHPFDDGNGRLSRLLMNYVLVKHNLPPVVIKSTDKRNYLFALNQADIGNYTAFIEYIAEQLIVSLELNIKAAKGENIEEEDDWEKKLTILKKKNSSPQEIIPKSVESVRKIITESAIPLVDEVTNVLSRYDDLFAESVCYFGNRSSYRPLNTSKHILHNTSKHVLQLLDEDNDSYMNDIRFIYALNGYKLDGTNTFNVDIVLTWQFDQFKYFFLLDESDYQKAQESLYSQMFNPMEMNAIARICGKKVMEKIETRSKNRL